MHSNPAFSAAAAAPTHPAGPGRRILDAPTRVFHWLFALSFLGAYLTADDERWRLLHVTLGYTLAGLLAFRLLYGLFGPRQARLGLLWRKLAGAPAWLRSLPAAGASGPPVNWRQGQNLLMALAVAALLALVLPLTISGIATYQEWGGGLGGDWLEEIHEFFGNTFLAVVLAHLALIAALSVLRRKNQALPMITGRTDGPGPDLVPHNRVWLATLLLVAVLGYWTWEWQQSPGGMLPSATSAAAHGGPQKKHHDDD